MSSDSSSSRGSSPVRFRPQSPGSDTGGAASSSWQPSTAFHPSSSFSATRPTTTTLHPSASLQASQPSTTPVLRQPVGFGTSPPSVPTYHAPQPESSAPAQHYLPGQIPPTEDPSKARKKVGKGKEKDAQKEKPKGTSRKGKEIDQGTTGQTAPSQASGGYPGQRTAFRVKSYSNDPTAVGNPYTIQDGPYGAAYRADLGDRPKAGGAKTTKKKGRVAAPQPQPEPPAAAPQVQPPTSQYQYPPPQPPTSAHPYLSQPQLAHGAQDAEPRNSYYRYDYDQLRQSAPGVRPNSSATPAPQPSAPPPPQPQAQHHHYSNPAPPPPPSTQDYYGHSSHSSKRKDIHMYSTGYQHQYSPPGHHYHQPSPSPPPSPPRDNYESMHPQHSWPPPAPPPSHTYATSYPPTYPPPLPPPSHSEKRHKSKSRPHRHEQTHYFPPAPAPPASLPPAPSVPPIPEVPPSAARVRRVLTLLIEDKRDPNGESMLAEVRVPLKPSEAGDGGFWADAQDVSEELQKGPSRIDGSAKVYTQRGKYKQYFLRIPVDGEPVCQPANLKVASDRTIEIVIEDNLPAGGKPVEAHVANSPPRLQRELLTPVTDSRTTPSPAPIHSSPKRPSMFGTEDARSSRGDKYDTAAYRVPRASETSRKRPRSSSMQSVQSMRSTYSENYSIPSQHHDSVSPLPYRPSSGRTSVSQTPSHASPPPPSEPAPMSPVSPPSDPPTPPHSYRPRASSNTAEPSTFSQKQSAPSATTPTPSAFMGSPSPTKKIRLTVTHSTSRRERSASPGPDRSAGHSWGNSRTPSLADSSATQMSGKSPRVSSATSSSSSAPTNSRFSNPFSRYESGFGLTSRQTSARDTASSPSTGITLPSIPSLSTVSNPTPPTTLAPSATSLAPTLSGTATSALDNLVGLWIRGVISKESQWDAFVKNRARVLKMTQQLEQYKYVQRIMDRYVGTTTPVDLEGAGGVTITKAQVMRAFNLSLAWGEDCTETLVMTTLYGPDGTRCADTRVCAMLDEEPPISTGIQAKKYLALLREVHGQWTIAHADGL